MNAIVNNPAAAVAATNKKIDGVNMRATMAAGAADKAANVANEAAGFAKKASEKADAILAEVS